MSANCEDKKCRICGFADTKNVHIFNAPNWQTLLTKILTVYPLVLYSNDPLPKHICKKCIFNVSFMYNDIQRVMKVQSKWISNVRRIEPNHNYARILDMIENANNVTRESIKSAFDVDVYKLSERMLVKNESTKEAQTFHSKFQKVQVQKATATQQSPAVKTTEKSPEIKEIKSILELNGCTLLPMDGAKQQKNVTTTRVSPTARDKPTTIMDVPELVDESSEDAIVVLPAISTSNCQQSKDFQCNYCTFKHRSLAVLATHQLQHLRLQLPRIFESRHLRKSERRGRLIVVNNRKCIRCLNCWRVFVDNKSILAHWSQADCDFYCQICGKEYAQAPKMLREHVPAAHGISYRSSKLPNKIRQNLDTAAQQHADYQLYQAVSEQEPLPNEEADKLHKTAAVVQADTSYASPAPTPPAKVKTQHTNTKNATLRTSDGSVPCPICFKEFFNMKARNSHMRKHKPSFLYGEVVLPLNGTGTDAYGRGDGPESDNESDMPVSMYGAKSEQSSDVPSSSNSSGVMRGVRTKFVQRRTDLPTSMGIRIKTVAELQRGNCLRACEVDINAWLPQLHAPSTSAPRPTPAAVVAIKEEPIDVDMLVLPNV